MFAAGGNHDKVSTVPKVRQNLNMTWTSNRRGNRPRPAQLAFTLVETLLGSVLTVIVFGALLVTIAYGFGVMQASSENNRATQILLERMEGLRLYTWDQLVSSNMVSPQFEGYFSRWTGPTPLRGWSIPAPSASATWPWTRLQLQRGHAPGHRDGHVDQRRDPTPAFHVHFCRAERHPELRLQSLNHAA